MNGWQQGTIKVCGVRTPEDIQACLQARVDLIGLVLVPGSKRELSLKQATVLRDLIGDQARVVGVFMNQPYSQVYKTTQALDLDLVQLHGQEQGRCWEQLGRPLIRRVMPSDYRRDRRASALPLVDAGAGHGIAHPWPATRYPEAMIAGGLTVNSVAALIEALEPAAVDVSSGVESSPGCKSPQAIDAFCRNARIAFGQVRRAQRSSNQ
ncbi:phosphoribosylanthranilate isomerase [Pseudomonas sp. G2-4]|uniref:phosphoribosylanthranilate isomerase n=1 Tax=Pseudomonas sp. G2-4 TaxID=1506334 RepID=UPI0024BA6643|nr:phosphoribosylanthranilate isomerase [Pseudomonas sp. G2-4]WHS62588.1 phosphoribosylanthranilate isomerase [Pseudomonas sp. G2-4]